MTGLHIKSNGAGKTLVLIHGWGMNSTIWGDFADLLSNHYRVITVDLPGHGSSARIAQFNLERIAELLIDTVPDEPCIWVGWSLGGLVALFLAWKYPSRVSHVVVLAGSPKFTECAGWPGMKQQILEKFAVNLRKNFQSAVLRFLSLQVKGLPDSRELYRRLKKSLFLTGIPDQSTLLGGLDILKTADLRQALTEMTHPILFVLGGKDVLVPAPVGEAVNSLSPAVEVCLIEEGGHVPFLSHQQEVQAKISGFVER